MAKRSCKLYPLTIVVAAMILAVFLIAPICCAGGAAALVPANDRGVPDGSFITEERIKKIEIKVKTFKAERKAKGKKQQQNRSPHNETPTPENLKEK
jgi:hypothetical protein